MIYKAYSVFDKATSAFLLPFFARTHGEAQRRFLQSVKDQADFKTYARDYELHYCGEFDDNIGEFGKSDDERASLPFRLMTGLEVLAIIDGEVEGSQPVLSSPCSPSARKNGARKSA